MEQHRNQTNKASLGGYNIRKGDAVQRFQDTTCQALFVSSMAIYSYHYWGDQPQHGVINIVCGSQTNMFHQYII